MYHGARALLYSVSYRERSHYCLRIALQELFVDTHILDRPFLDAFSAAMRLRENADYRSDFSKGGATLLVESAGRFLAKAKQVLSIP